jgi:hypothetical protein
VLVPDTVDALRLDQLYGLVVKEHEEEQAAMEAARRNQR